MPLAAILLALAPSVAALLDRPVPEWPEKPSKRWVQGGPLALQDLRGKVVLVRFFMDADCPYCRATAPALNALHQELGPEGLVVVGMLTPKPRPRPVGMREARRTVRAHGFEFPVAIDDDWSALRRLWLDRVPGAAFTSSTLLIDREGILRPVHEGGVFSPDSRDPRAREDFEELRREARRLLAKTTDRKGGSR